MSVTVIIFDTETNGLSSADSVLSIGAFKVDYTCTGSTVSSREIGRYLRYYYRAPGEKENKDALRVNGLSIEVITKKRADTEADYPEHFNEDPGFCNFCAGVDHFVGHNIAYDLQYIPFLRSRSRKNLPKKHFFCTMLTNTPVLKLCRADGYTLKWPNLKKTAAYYGVDMDEDAFHDSAYDAAITRAVFEKMLENGNKDALDFVKEEFSEYNRELF